MARLSSPVPAPSGYVHSAPFTSPYVHSRLGHDRPRELVKDPSRCIGCARQFPASNKGGQLLMPRMLEDRHHHRHQARPTQRRQSPQALRVGWTSYTNRNGNHAMTDPYRGDKPTPLELDNAFQRTLSRVAQDHKLPTNSDHDDGSWHFPPLTGQVDNAGVVPAV